MRSILLALAAAAVTAAAVVRVWPGDEAPRPAPAVAFVLLDGRQSNLQALQGKVVLVNFWATSCAPCVKEMPQLVATHQRYAAQGFETLAVAMHYDPPARVVQFAESHRLPFGVVIDNLGQMARGFGGVRLTPTSYLLNRRGEIVERYLGEPDAASLRRRVEALLAES